MKGIQWHKMYTNISWQLLHSTHHWYTLNYHSSKVFNIYNICGCIKISSVHNKWWRIHHKICSKLRIYYYTHKNTIILWAFLLSCTQSSLHKPVADTSHDNTDVLLVHTHLLLYCIIYLIHSISKGSSVSMSVVESYLGSITTLI